MMMIIIIIIIIIKITRQLTGILVMCIAFCSCNMI
jgi:hypothetical protein